MELRSKVTHVAEVKQGDVDDTIDVEQAFIIKVCMARHILEGDLDDDLGARASTTRRTRPVDAQRAKLDEQAPN